MIKKSGLLFAVALAAVSAPAMAAERLPIEVLEGGASLVTLERPVRNLIVGNPAVADVTVENGTTILVFGKQRGGTTLTALDGAGAPIMEAKVVVGAGGGGAVAVTWAAGKDIKPGGEGVTYVCGAATCAKALPIPAKNGGGSAPAGPGPEAAVQ